MTRKYSSISVETTLATGISNSATIMTVASGTGSALMGGVTLAPGNTDIFTVALDVDTQNEEVVYITAVSSDTFTIVRGRAGTSAISHTGGATVKHVLTSDDLNFYTAGVATADAAVPEAVVTAKADLLVASASGVVDNLAVGTNGQVLTADATQTLGMRWSAIIPSQTGNAGKYLKTDGTSTSWETAVSTLDLTLNAQTGTTYTAVSGDANKLVTLNNASAITVTIPNAVFTVGQQINFLQLGVGQVTFQGDGTSTIVSNPGVKTRAQYSIATVVCIATNTFLLTGDITA
jgi:hypothetical protein